METINLVNLILICCCLMICCVWFYTVFLSGKLFRKFVEKFPLEAERNIPFASTHIQHPEKFFYFFRQGSIPTLRKDLEIWKLRQRLKWFVLASTIVPLIAFGILIICACKAM